MAGGLTGRVVTGIARCQAEAERGRGKREHQCRRRHRGQRRPPLHAAHPAQPEAWLHVCARGSDASVADASDPVTKHRQQSREEGQRRGQDYHYSDRGGDGRAREQTDAEREHSEQRDDHRDAGEKHRPA